MSCAGRGAPQIIPTYPIGDADLYYSRLIPAVTTSDLRSIGMWLSLGVNRGLPPITVAPVPIDLRSELVA